MTYLSNLTVEIANLQYELLSVEDQADPVKGEISELESEFDAIVAFDTELKNEPQRKARRNELQAKDCWYQELTITLKEFTRHKQQLMIELELKRNQFAVAKLEARIAIAKAEELLMSA